MLTQRVFSGSNTLVSAINDAEAQNFKAAYKVYELCVY
jgi:hypothetical protein